jgi:hypothetical protein
MGNQIITNKTLYHIVTSFEAKEISKTGFITPWPRGSYLSVNVDGNFDQITNIDLNDCCNERIIEEVQKGRNWIQGSSFIQNIFLSDSLEVQMPLRGSKEVLTHAYTFTVQEIMKQHGLKVFKNPSGEFPALYNVPCMDGKGLRIVNGKRRVIYAPETVTDLLKRGRL